MKSTSEKKDYIKHKEHRKGVAVEGFDKKRAVRDLKANLSEERYLHSLGVAKTAKRLAEIHGEDADKAYLAGLFHDFAKYISTEDGLDYLKKMKVNDGFLLDNSNLAHGQIGAYILEKEYSLEDKEILSAIAKHTFGDVNMSKLDKIIYIADAIEPNRDYPSVEDLRKLAEEDLNLTCLEYLKNSFKYLIKNNKKIYHKSIDMYNTILERGINGF